MAWSITDLFPPWGDNGERPPDNFQYDGGDQVNEKHLDYLWYEVGELEKEVRAALEDIDSDKDGTVDNADKLDGTELSDIAVSIEDSGTLIVDPSSGINFGSNLAVTDDGDGTVTVDGSAGGTSETDAYYHGGLG